MGRTLAQTQSRKQLLKAQEGRKSRTKKVLSKARAKLHRIRYNLRLKRAPFYRVYPHQSDIALVQADALGLVDLQYKFFYDRIPKAANSTIVGMLAKNIYGSEFSSEQEVKQLFNTTPVDLDARQVSRFKDFYKFTFVRDPYVRVLSAYLDKITGGKKLKKYNLRSFGDFVSYLEYGGLYEDAHWAPQVSLFLIPPQMFDFIGKVENLEQDIKSVCTRIFENPQYPRKLRLNSYNVHATDAAYKLQKYYVASLRTRIESLYKEDFKTFQYTVFARRED